MRIEKRVWGLVNGEQAYLFDLEAHGLRAAVSNYGGVLQSLVLKDDQGDPVDVVLGYDTLEEYIRSETFFGAMVGPIADRLADGRCTLDGSVVQLPLNAGPDCMHSGPGGFHARLWNWELLEDGIAFFNRFTDGEFGLPGCLRARLCYRITDEGSLRLEYSAVCDHETALSFTNHSYFTLNGGRGDCRGHLLLLRASGYAETCRDEEPICTGRVLSVQDTPFDFRNAKVIGPVLDAAGFAEIRTGGGIDHYFPVDGAGMRVHAMLASPEDGLMLTCRSDAPGVLVYSANGLDGERGKGGAVYGRNWALCLETECFPNAVNQPHLRSQVLLQPGEEYKSSTEFVLSRC